MVVSLAVSTQYTNVTDRQSATARQHRARYVQNRAAERPIERWSKPLLSVAWTTATRCATASPTNWRATCSQFRTLPHSASCSRLRLSSTGPCPATPRVTWLVADARVRQPCSADTRTLVVSRTRNTFGAGHLPQQDHESGTVCRPISRLRGPSYGQFMRLLKTVIFGQWGHGAVWTVLTAPNRNILAYLLTYVLHCVCVLYSCPAGGSCGYVRWFRSQRVRSRGSDEPPIHVPRLVLLDCRHRQRLDGARCCLLRLCRLLRVPPGHSPQDDRSLTFFTDFVVFLSSPDDVNQPRQKSIPLISRWY